MTRLKKWTRRAGIGLLTLLALGLVLWTAGELWTRPMLEEALAESRELGTLEFRDLLSPAPPASENGIWDLERAGALLRETRSGTSLPQWPKDDAKDADARKAEIRRILRERPEPLEAARKAADAPSIHQDLTPRPGQDLASLLLPHLSPLKECARLLEASARLSAEEGRTDEALADAARIFRMARSPEREPVLISVLVAGALRETAFRTLDAVLRDGAAADPRILAELSGCLETSPNLTPRILLSERAFGWDCFQRLLGAGAVELPGLPRGTWMTLPARPWLRWEASQYLRYMNAGIRAGTLTQAGPLPSGYLTPLLLPAFSSAETSLLRIRAKTGALGAALAVREALRTTGRLPEALPEGFEDPLTGKPLAYRPEPDGSGFAVYSLGENGKDDGGDLVIPKGGSQAPDLGVRWKVPARK